MMGEVIMANKSARDWLDEIGENPEKFGITREHLKKVDALMKKVEEEWGKKPHTGKRKEVDDEGGD
jgi:hypothetical protein